MKHLAHEYSCRDPLGRITTVRLSMATDDAPTASTFQEVFALMGDYFRTVAKGSGCEVVHERPVPTADNPN